MPSAATHGRASGGARARLKQLVAEAAGLLGDQLAGEHVDRGHGQAGLHVRLNQVVQADADAVEVAAVHEQQALGRRAPAAVLSLHGRRVRRRVSAGRRARGRGATHVPPVLP